MLTFSSKIPNEEKKIQKHRSFLSQTLQNKKLGFHQLPFRHEMWHEVKASTGKLQGRQALILIGIGGSALGGKVFYDSTLGSSKRNNKKIFFWDNLDPLKIESDLIEIQSIGIENVGVVAISKSGNTIETLSLLELLNNVFSESKVSKNLLVLTEEKESLLFNYAHKVAAQFLAVPKDVGGRFSVLTPVGLVVAVFLGLDLEKLKKGSQVALEPSELNKNAEFCAQIEQSFERGEWITVFWTYSEALKSFGFWLQQLWCESLAKSRPLQEGEVKRCSTLLPCVGVTDQHSLLQQFSEGAKDKFIIFVRNRASESHKFKLGSSIGFSSIEGKSLGQILYAEVKGTQQSLQEAEVNQSQLVIEKLDEETLGYLFMFFELTIASLGLSLNIDAFNQPGVERGKVIALELLAKNE